MCFDRLTKPKNSMMLLMMGGSVSIIVLLIGLGYANASFPNEYTCNVKINGIMNGNENIKSGLGNVELYNCNNTTHALAT
jgi:hypothetical protein